MLSAFRKSRRISCRRQLLEHGRDDNTRVNPPIEA